MRKIRWGVLSTSKFGTEIAIPAMQKGKWSEILAIASRDFGKAQAAADRLGIPRAYGSYKELLADPEVEAVYNPLPNHLHVPWSNRALEAGKHVLCEKPIARTALEAGELLASDQDTIQADRFSEAALGRTALPTPLSDAVANLVVTDAVLASAASGSWVEC